MQNSLLHSLPIVVQLVTPLMAWMPLTLPIDSLTEFWCRLFAASLASLSCFSLHLLLVQPREQLLIDTIVALQYDVIFTIYHRFKGDIWELARDYEVEEDKIDSRILVVQCMHIIMECRGIAQYRCMKVMKLTEGPSL